jgi:hypothetical protein
MVIFFDDLTALPNLMPKLNFKNFFGAVNKNLF